MRSTGTNRRKLIAVENPTHQAAKVLHLASLLNSTVCGKTMPELGQPTRHERASPDDSVTIRFSRDSPRCGAAVWRGNCACLSLPASSAVARTLPDSGHGTHLGALPRPQTAIGPAPEIIEIDAVGAWWTSSSSSLASFACRCSEACTGASARVPTGILRPPANGSSCHPSPYRARSGGESTGPGGGARRDAPRAAATEGCQSFRIGRRPLGLVGPGLQRPHRGGP